MCLTELGAGSDLSRIRCRATRNGAEWTIAGEKIFISGGDQEMSEDILHLVLARTSDDGLRGLSLFLCPSSNARGGRNGISVMRIDEKMGLHASPTCHLLFADAELVGDEGKGLAAMFTMMNHARLKVALQGVAHAGRAYDMAAHYAAERIQGRGSDGASVAIDRHPDIRRMLDEIAALTVGGRGLVHLALTAMEKGDDPDLVEFLTPLAKVYCTKAGIRAAELGMQVLGGYGYLREYRLERTYRDARVTAIYEGANGIHERAISTRLLSSAPGDAFERFIESEVDERQVARWAGARAEVAAATIPAVLSYDYFALTAETTMQAIWTRVLSTACEHPRPDWLKRIAQRAKARSQRRTEFFPKLVSDQTK